MSNIGSLIQALREKRGLSCRALAGQAGISHPTIRNWETGIFVPRLPELLQTLTVLQASPQEERQALEMLERPRAITHIRRSRQQTTTDAFAGVPVGIGDLLRAMRVRHGCTLEQIAALLQCAPRTISRWERGETRPNTNQLHACCQAMNASPDEVAMLTIGNLSQVTDNAFSLEAMRAEFDALWSPPFSQEKASLLELSYLALVVRLQALPWHKNGRSELLLQVYAALANHYYTHHQSEKAALFAAQAVSIANTLPAVSGLVVVAVIRFSQTSWNHLQAWKTLRDWLPRMPNPEWEAWLLSEMAENLARRNSHTEAETISCQSLQKVEGDELHGRILDRANLLLYSNQTEKAEEVLNSGTQDIRPHVSMAWAKMLLARKDFTGAQKRVIETLRSLEEMTEYWSHMIPFYQRPAERLARMLESV